MDFLENYAEVDKKVGMSLDEIIALNRQPKRGPGSHHSGRSHVSFYSTRSNWSYHSHKSNYSHRSNRSNYSQRSNRSNYSQRSNRSNYSHRSNFSQRNYFQKFNVNPSYNPNFDNNNQNFNNYSKNHYNGRNNGRKYFINRHSPHQEPNQGSSIHVSPRSPLINHLCKNGFQLNRRYRRGYHNGRYNRNYRPHHYRRYYNHNHRLRNNLRMNIINDYLPAKVTPQGTSHTCVRYMDVDNEDFSSQPPPLVDASLLFGSNSGGQKDSGLQSINMVLKPSSSTTLNERFTRHMHT